MYVLIFLSWTECGEISRRGLTNKNYGNEKLDKRFDSKKENALVKSMEKGNNFWDKYMIRKANIMHSYTTYF